MDSIGITANKNTVPDDPQSPFVTSGVRLGTPAMTTRGMGTAESIEIAHIITEALKNPDSLEDLKPRVTALHTALSLVSGIDAGPNPLKDGYNGVGLIRHRSAITHVDNELGGNLLGMGTRGSVFCWL